MLLQTWIYIRAAYYGLIAVYIKIVNSANVSNQNPLLKDWLKKKLCLRQRNTPYTIMYVVDEGEAKIVAEPQWAHLQEAQGDGRQPPGGEGLVGGWEAEVHGPW